MQSADEDALSTLWIEKLSPGFERLAVQWVDRVGCLAVPEATGASRTAALLRKIQRNELRFRGSDDLWQLVAAATLVRFEDEVSLIVQPADLAARMTRTGRPLLDELADPDLESVALLKLTGKTNETIAAHLDRTRRTIQRMIKLIRDIWRSQVEN